MNQITAMGKSQPIILPSKTFTSTSSAGLFLKEMLGRYRDEDQINPSDSQLLFEFLQRHPEAEQKIGIGISKFFKRRSPDFPTSGFHIERLDGSTTDFALKECLSGQKPTLEIYFYRACRSSISPYLTSLKNELFTNGPVYCQKTGRQTTKETSEYRHTIPEFREIVEEFKHINAIVMNEQMFTPSQDMQYMVKFSDPNMGKRFINFHKSRAALEIHSKL